jgi:hypothetical protein
MTPGDGDVHSRCSQEEDEFANTDGLALATAQAMEQNYGVLPPAGAVYIDWVVAVMGLWLVYLYL